jgi:hypothetical protein
MTDDQANTTERQPKGQPEKMKSYDQTATIKSFYRIIVLARDQGLSVRALAKIFGMSKSKMGREVQTIETLRNLGQLDEFFALFSTADQTPSVPNVPALLDGPAAPPDHDVASDHPGFIPW